MLTNQIIATIASFVLMLMLFVFVFLRDKAKTQRVYTLLHILGALSCLGLMFCVCYLLKTGLMQAGL